MNRQVNINTKYKDRLFRLLFGSYERKDNIISLYNALNNSSYNADDTMSASEPTRLRDWRTANCDHDSCEAASSIKCES
jgi:hypothetical protein